MNVSSYARCLPGSRGALIFLMAGFVMALPASAAVEVRQLDAVRAVDGQRLVFVDMPVGEIEVTGGDTGQIEIDVVIQCSRLSRRCRNRAESIELVIDERPSAFEVHFEGYPSHNVGGAPALEVTVRIPEALDFELEMGVGDVDITALRGDVRVDLGVGDVLVEVAEDTVGSVSLDVGVGSADIDPAPPHGDRSGFLFLGNELRWDDGPGRSEIDIEVGVGEANVRLE